MDRPISVEQKCSINPGFSTILSFFYSGLGQLYNGEIVKGMIIMSFSTLGVILTIIGAILIGHYLLRDLNLRLELLWGIGLLVGGIALIGCFGAYSLFDAYNSAQRRLSDG